MSDRSLCQELLVRIAGIAGLDLELVAVGGLAVQAQPGRRVVQRGEPGGSSAARQLHYPLLHAGAVAVPQDGVVAGRAGAGSADALGRADAQAPAERL